ncbi:MAG: histidine triad nucleotide-binding protein [Calditrichia bacterium]
MSQCPFCQIAEHKLTADILFEDKEVVVFHDNNPQAPVHFLVIPRRHIPALSDSGKADQSILGKLLLSATRQAEQLDLNQSGYRVVINNGKAGGQEVPHLHVHVLGGRRMKWPPG